MWTRPNELFRNVDGLWANFSAIDSAGEIETGWFSCVMFLET